MSVKYRAVNFRFNAQRWADDLNRQNDIDLVAAQQLSGISSGGWWHWLNPRRSKVFEYPLMGNFLMVCNLLDLDPRDYFELES